MQHQTVQEPLDAGRALFLLSPICESFHMSVSLDAARRRHTRPIGNALGTWQSMLRKLVAPSRTRFLEMGESESTRVRLD